MDKSKIEDVETWLSEEQARFINQVIELDNLITKHDDSWEKGIGSSGRTVVLSDGSIFEKIAVNYSSITGDSLPEAASAKRPDLKGSPFRAMGLSIVSHPKNPFVPTAHQNLRLFSTLGQQESNWWFGGGFDLTPYFGFSADSVTWHRLAEKVCAPYGADIYEKFKKQCDDYFSIKHRKEQRGIGGLFFDDLNYWPFEICFNFIKDVGRAFSAGYFDIVNRRWTTEFTAEQREFQRYRRGRYVEFNLVHDRGTLFGLQFGGRINSILASLPPTVAWPYAVSENFEKYESTLLNQFLTPRDWLNEDSGK
mgnify:CR=1 FL=1